MSRVSFDVAWVAREKDYPQKDLSVYFKSEPYYKFWKKDFWYDEPYLACPLQSEVQAWLRDKHNIHFIIECLDNNGGYRISIHEIDTFEIYPIDDRFYSYELALENGLSRVINQI